MKRPHHGKKPYHYVGRGSTKLTVKQIYAGKYKIKPPFHPDEQWIKDLIGGHGGAYWLSNGKKPSHIIYIFGKKKPLILWYNFLLFLRLLKCKFN